MKKALLLGILSALSLGLVGFTFGGSLEESCGRDKDVKSCDILCNQGKTDFCNMSAFLYAMNKDFDKAIDRGKKACNKANPSSCIGLGFAYSEKGDYSKAESLLKSACDSNNPYACAILGSLYDKKGNLLEEAKAYEKACYLGDYKGIERACFDGAITYVEIYGENANDETKMKVMEMLKRACNLGENRACKVLSKNAENEPVETGTGNKGAVMTKTQTETKNIMAIGTQAILDSLQEDLNKQQSNEEIIKFASNLGLFLGKINLIKPEKVSEIGLLKIKCDEGDNQSCQEMKMKIEKIKAEFFSSQEN